ncbi:GntR family transcriptional regulator [Saccharomonospora sp. NB11]|jgi:GntR family transcriptional regulator|uniref:GntR family transcriptional regulator n=1 Tax=Saccharomonospora sp. NB11 TaxID=1642298 RepID=UPI0018D146A6|nr:GntR family transcriptional regulator [Saccharomonospora sp. NB11]
MGRGRDASSRSADRIVDGPTPKHEQLRGILRALVTRDLPPGSAIPSERELAARYNVSRLTVRTAVGRLVDEGLLHRVRGRGTFTTAPRLDLSLHLLSFTTDMRRRGLRASSRVLCAATEVPPEATRRVLGLAPGRPAHRVRRVRLADDVPLAVEDGWYHPDVVGDVLALDLTGSLYAQLADHRGVRFDSARQTVTAETARGELAELLGLRPGAPLLAFRRVAGLRGRTAEDSTSWYRGDRYQISVALDPSDGDRSRHDLPTSLSTRTDVQKGHQ